MIKCDYCEAELDRNVFCDSRCKVAFHRKKPVTKGNKIKESVTISNKWCKHGYLIILCNKGCNKYL